jgi:hypothetical protein
VKTQVGLRSPQTTGLSAGDWCAFGRPGEAPADQRGDDGCSLTFDSEPLRERIEILGAPVATLEVAADQPVALIAVRLNDVAPDDTSSRVTYGLLNLTHRNSHEHPEPLEPGTRYRIRVAMNDIAHAISAGHKLRLAISTSYWPIAWPAPQPATVDIFTGESFVDLPVRPSDPKDAERKPFAPPEQARAQQTELRSAPLRRIVKRDRASNETIYTISSGRGDFDGGALARVEAIDLDVGHTILKRFRIGENDPLTAQAEVVQKTLFRRDAWKTQVETYTRFSSTRDYFLLQAELKAYAGEEQVFARTWERRVKRDLL